MEARLGGHRDPGYWETARMILEAGLCLALQARPLLHCAALTCITLHGVSYGLLWNLLKSSKLSQWCCVIMPPLVVSHL